MMLCTVEDVKIFTGIKPQQLRLEKTDDSKLDEILGKWIEQCSDLIINYCHNQFEKEVPPAVENACLRVTANMIALYVARKDTPVVKVNDWSVQIIKSDIFTEDIKEDLDPFKIDFSNKSDSVDFFTISGDTQLW